MGDDGKEGKRCKQQHSLPGSNAPFACLVRPQVVHKQQGFSYLTFVIHGQLKTENNMRMPCIDNHALGKARRTYQIKGVDIH